MDKKLLSICLKCQIGSGGFSRIFSCVSCVPNGTKSTPGSILKAVKCIPNSESCGPLCITECALMSKFRHPNLNFAIQIGFTIDKVYIVQDLAICDLLEWRKTKFTSSESDSNLIFTWLKQIISALRFLHSGNIVHCDVKASNVLLMADSTCKLTDFGLSIRLDWLKSDSNDNTSGRSICTASHRPLEVWLGQSWDTSVDIWAFGCLTHELYFGGSPFTTKDGKHSRDEMINKIKTFCLVESGDSSGTGLIKKILRVDPRERPTAQEVGMLLEDGEVGGEQFEIWKTDSKKKRSKLPASLGSGLPEHLIWALYDKIKDLDGIKDSDKVKACTFIYSKMIHGQNVARGFLSEVSKWIELERQILKHVNFDLPL